MAEEEQKPCPNCGTPNPSDAQFCRTCGTPLAAEQPELVGATAGQQAAHMRDEITSITDPLLQMGLAASVGDLIVTSLRRVLQDAGPRQAEVLRRCAIPRWFDLGVLAVLREREDGNERVLELLRDYSFVRPLGDGRFSYHDEIRTALVAEWQAQRHTDFLALNQRLAAYFTQRAARTGPPPANGHPPPPDEPRQMGEWQICLRESIYHQLVADPASGMLRLRSAFEQAEAEYRLADAEALLLTSHGTTLDASQQHWLRYMRARLDRDALRLNDASDQLTSLLAEPTLDAELAALARRTLGEVRAETGGWIQATDLYQQSLAYFAANGRAREAAEMQLLLGEAYQEIATNAGGWHVPAYPQQPLARRLGELWYTLLTVPFRIVLLFLRHTPWSLPRPQFLAFYQNWPLIWIYRTAQRWYEQARTAFAALGDERGLLRAEQQLAQILLIFGYEAEALALLDRLRARPAARTATLRYWLDTDRAAAKLALGDIAGAQALIEPALAHFHSIGDIRREAAVLALRGRAAAHAGQYEAALNGYRESLARYRALDYDAAREDVLYDLRAWQRRVGPGPLAEQITALLDAEPEKRYVARFPRSLLLYLQVLSVATVPLALLAMALIAPTKVVQAIAGSQPLSLQTFYDPRAALGVLAVLVPLYLAAYTLVALVVIFFAPRRAVERNQPDYLVTDPQALTRYDARGKRAERIAWGDIARWIRVDRRIWVRPMALISATFVAASDTRTIPIDGITGWYTALQDDIAHHLGAVGNRLRAEQIGFHLLRSKSGALFGLGLLLQLIFLPSQNNWSQWLLQLLPPQVYAALSFLAFSGALLLVPLAYWLATGPLYVIRTLALRNRWAQLMAVVGLGAMTIYAFAASQPDPVHIALLIWGAYVLANAIYTIFFPQLRMAGLALMVIAPLLTTALAADRISASYLVKLSEVAANNAAIESSTGSPAPGKTQAYIEQSLDAAGAIVQQPGASQEQKAEAFFNAGRALYADGAYARAAAAFEQSLRLYEAAWNGADSSEIRQTRYVVYFNWARALRKTGDPAWRELYAQACRNAPEYCNNQEP